MSIDKETMPEILVTRQPIFDHKKDVIAYNLFFDQRLREQYTNITAAEERQTTLKAADSFLLNGFKTLSGGKKVFVHFSPDMLISQLPLLFPQKLLGVEILDQPTTWYQMLKAVKKIKTSGYQVMLGDDALSRRDASMLKLADIIGCDFRSHHPQECNILEEEEKSEIKLLAKGVETPTDFGAALEIGYQYFQGDFFSKADLIPVRNIPSYKITLLKLLKEINKPTVEFERIEELLKKDISITYKLLRFINSARFGLKTTVESIRHALNLMGEAEVRKWLSLIVLSGTGSDKPKELVTNTIVRAKFCESIAKEMDEEQDMAKYFLMGMFGSVDAFMDRPMDEIMGELPLDDLVKGALMGEENHFRDVLDVVMDYERGDWKNFSYSAKKLDLNEKIMVTLYLDAVEWATLF